MAGRRAKLSVSQETRILREKRSRRKLLKKNLFSETGTKVGERFLKTFFLNASEATTTTTAAKMKPMSIACAVTVIIACVCVSQSAAVPFSEPEVTLRPQLNFHLKLILYVITHYYWHKVELKLPFIESQLYLSNSKVPCLFIFINIFIYNNN